MSITPPPTYSPPKQEATALTSVVTDLKDALAQVTNTATKTATIPEVAKKHFNVENPTPVNVFVSSHGQIRWSRDYNADTCREQNYTGAVFDDDEEYEYADYLVSTDSGDIDVSNVIGN
jgi:acid phosphatase class B